MGKKTKIGKARKDKFYQLAKETGYRSRAAFKLIQLNRKFEFLQKSRVVVDLCAAPGGWAQVAAENTPVSSVIVAIDLVPIRPIHNVTGLQEDITTDKCRQSIKKELQTWKADCFLNDGAPNVGKNWLHDAFQQAVLTLHAMKLATEFLRKGGWFVTKVFRSKDYTALLWVFQQLFKHVHATKPQASRKESAEIFVVCQGYLAPDKIDPKFLDPKHVFKEADPETKAVQLDMIHPEKRRKQTQGYPEGDYTLHHTITALDFINSDQYTELLSTTNAISIDDVRILNHKLTTEEIKECCTDIKVLGKKELKSLVTWRKKMKQYLEDLEGKNQQGDKEKAEDDEDKSEDEEAEIEKQLTEARETERRALKRKLKKIRLEKNKLRHKMDMKMIIPGDVHDFSDDVGLFHLDKLKNKQHLDKMEVEEFSFDEDEDEADGQSSRRPMMTFDRESKDYLDSASSDEEEALQGEDLESDGDSEKEAEESNPLVVSLEDRATQRSREVDSWFGKEAFAGLENEEDENLEVEKMMTDYRKKGGIVLENTKHSTNDQAENSQKTDKPKKKKVSVEQDSDSDSGNESVSSDESESSDSDSDSDSNVLQSRTTTTEPVRKKKKLNNANKDGFEVVPSNMEGIDPHLDSVGLAMGAAMATSQKRKRDIIDQAYNRYSFQDSNLPDWFAADERRHHRRPLPVTKEEVMEYKQREKEINARPIKKVAEAKARKKRKMMKKLEKARKKSEAITDSADVSEREKWSQIKHIYKKAGLLKEKKPELTYVVAKKGMGKRVRRPAGVQGHFKVVDPRMKKDSRKVNAREKKPAKGKKGKSTKKR